MKRLSIILLLLALFLLQNLQSQTFRSVKGWSKEVNNQLNGFLNSTLPMKERKVAVFDCDGTTFEQVSHYLADEALYQYADEVLKKRNNKEAKKRLSILDRMVKNGNNVGKSYVEDRVHFLAGLTPEKIETIGYDCCHMERQVPLKPS